MNLFYAPQIVTSPVLPEEESGHAIRVLRLDVGDPITITDGKGGLYDAIIRRAHPKHCEVDIVAMRQQVPLWPFQIHIAVAPPKNIDRMEWLVEKVTEIGIDAITCLRCRYSERREINTARIEKIMASAMKQSLKARLPQLNGMVAFQDFITRTFTGSKYIAHCAEGEKQLLQHACDAGENALILIGPEGDFSSEEIAQAVEHGFRPVSLGASRLRTETAALTACQWIHFMNQY